ncbi:MAG: hypothetical protein E2O68_03900 [Deltaproteobacteria bacterium]|nr:MAG: hypothetical protein E2O68_03900 [Deltaproteobacteria bacterium]
MKKGLIGTALITMTALVWWMFVNGDQEDLADYDIQLEKAETKKIAKTEKFLKNLENPNVPRLYGRLVIGKGMTPLSKWPEQINYINKIDPNWDKKTAAHLNEASTYDRKVKITKMGGFIALNADEGLYLERALVEFIQPDGSEGSFEAVINSQTGEIELVLNKNINESLAVEDPKIDYPDPYDPKNFMASAEELRDIEEADSDELVEAMVSEANEEFDAYEYEEEIAVMDQEIIAMDTDENHQEFVENLERDISSEH